MKRDFADQNAFFCRQSKQSLNVRPESEQTGDRRILLNRGTPVQSRRIGRYNLLSEVVVSC